MGAGRISGFSRSKLVLWFSCGLLMSVGLAAKAAGQDSSQAKPSEQTAASKSLVDTPRGKKLILKDGTYQIVREYQRNGDRVRYYSEERGDWEEVPTSMVDWDATAKDAAASEQAATAVTEKIHEQEEAKRIDNVQDIDASLRVGEGAFLPDAEGLFVVEGKSVRVLKQVGAGAKTDKARTLEQILSPIPIVPGKQRVIIEGEHASLRLRTTTPEFYLREAPPDPESNSPIERSSRPGESGPDVVLLRAKVIHKARELESIKTLFGEKIGANVDEIPIQRWEVAKDVYRYTLGEALMPGEYVMAEVLPGGLNYFVWDFGVDGQGATSTKK